MQLLSPEKCSKQEKIKQSQISGSELNSLFEGIPVKWFLLPLERTKLLGNRLSFSQHQHNYKSTVYEINKIHYLPLNMKLRNLHGEKYQLYVPVLWDIFLIL